MRKLPFRTNNEITQSFNDGVVYIYSVSDIAEPGYKPKEGLTLKCTLRFEEQRLGLNRLYLSRQAMVEIDRVIRVQDYGDISTQDVAVTGGKQYRIDTKQLVMDVYPKCVDISLVRIEQEYEVMA